jgi:hypothetical protein
MPRGVIGGTGIDASQFKEVAKALKVAQPMLYKELGKSLAVAGRLIANDAKAIASKHSESIPPTIKVRRRGVGVQVVAGGADVPIAGLFELGSKGNRSSATGGTFRHPVFGNRDNWVDQEMHPFLAPAGRKNQAAVDALVFKALDAVTGEIVNGFGGSST